MNHGRLIELLGEVYVKKTPLTCLELTAKEAAELSEILGLVGKIDLGTLRR